MLVFTIASGFCLEFRVLNAVARSYKKGVMNSFNTHQGPELECVATNCTIQQFTGSMRFPGQIGVRCTVIFREP